MQSQTSFPHACVDEIRIKFASDRLIQYRFYKGSEQPGQVDIQIVHEL